MISLFRIQSRVYIEYKEMENFLEKSQQSLRTDGYLILLIKVTPGSRKTRFMSLLKSSEPILKIALSAPPEKGKANQELCHFLEDFFGGDVCILSGQISPLKKIRINKKELLTQNF